MIPGIELWPDQDDHLPIAQADLDLLVAATHGLDEVLLKVRFHDPEQLRQLVRAVPGAQFVTRPRAEGYTATEIATGVAAATRGIFAAGFQNRWICHEIANEPNHPAGPFRDGGAEGFAGVLRDAVKLIGSTSAPLGSPGLTPYYGTAAWSRMLGQFAWAWRCGHCYWQDEHIDDGVADALAQTDGAPVGQVLITEVGDASVARDLLPRIQRTGRVMCQLARRGVAGAALFILRAPDPAFARFLLPPSAIRDILQNAARKTRTEDATMPSNQISSWKPLIIRAAGLNHVSPALIAAVMAIESGGRPTGDDGAILTSPAGALGLMQLLPGTAQALGVDPADAEQNVAGGARYLATMYNRFRDWTLAIAAYNAGPEAVAHAGGVPDFPETIAYVRGVKSYVLDYLDWDTEQIAVDNAAGQHAPDTATWREAYGNVLGVANLLAQRIRDFQAANADV